MAESVMLIIIAILVVMAVIDIRVISRLRGALARERKRANRLQIRASYLEGRVSDLEAKTTRGGHRRLPRQRGPVEDS